MVVGVGPDAVEVEVVEVDAVEVEMVVAAEGGRPGRPMLMSSFQFTRLAGLPIHRIGPSSLHLCDGGIVQTMRKTIALRMQN